MVPDREIGQARKFPTSDEALAGLWELENSVVVVHLVSDVGIAAGKVLLEHRPDSRLIQAAQIAKFAARPIGTEDQDRIPAEKLPADAGAERFHLTSLSEAPRSRAASPKTVPKARNRSAVRLEFPRTLLHGPEG